MTTSSSNNPGKKVLVTGFGPFLDITNNPSWGIACQLPSTLTRSSSEAINIAVPSQPIPAAYHKLALLVPQFIQEYAPDLVLHMGLDVESESGPGVFKVERSAPKEGYHDIPDVERKVLTRAENKKIFGKAPASLVTTLDLDTAVEAWGDACQSMWLPKPGVFTSKSKNKSKRKNEDKQSPHLQQSDNIGTYVCGLNYYVSMMEMQKKTGK